MKNKDVIGGNDHDVERYGDKCEMIEQGGYVKLCIKYRLIINEESILLVLWTIPHRIVCEAILGLTIGNNVDKSGIWSSN